MSVAISGTAAIYRSSNYDRFELRKIGLSGGSDALEEFASSLDFSDLTNLPNLPISIVTPGITSIKFLVIIVTGGTATVRLTTSANAGLNSIDLPITSGTLILTGCDLTSVVLISTQNKCYVEVYGSGS